jgi:hypothetical protein
MLSILWIPFLRAQNLALFLNNLLNLGVIYMCRVMHQAFKRNETEFTKFSVDNPNTTQTLEYTKDKYNAKIIK